MLEWLFLVLFFPVLENIVMSQHAIQYTYDRMKLIFGISLLICELSYNLLNESKVDFSTFFHFVT